MKTQRFFLLSVLLTILLSAPYARALQIVVQPGPGDSMDTSIMNNNPDTNVGNETLMLVSDYNDISGHLLSYALLKFNIPSSVLGAVINEVKLSMIGMPMTMIPVLDAIYVHRITSAWDHQAVTWNTQPTFEATPEVKLTLAQNGILFDLEADITGLFQKWVNGDYDNQGILISTILPQNLPQGVNGSIMYLLSSETDQGEQGRPKLTITTESDGVVPEPATVLLLCLGLVGVVGRRR